LTSFTPLGKIVSNEYLCIPQGIFNSLKDCLLPKEEGRLSILTYTGFGAMNIKVGVNSWNHGLNKRTKLHLKLVPSFMNFQELLRIHP
jgi:hypothetical protein